LGIARLDVSVVESPAHGVADVAGGGTAISGLRPGAVAPDGTVASLKSDMGTVLELGSIEAALLPEEMGKVEAALLPEELGKVEAALLPMKLGLHVPDVIDAPNGEMTGGDATKGGDNVGEPGVPTAALVLTVVLVARLVIAVVGHIVIAPRELPGIGPRFPKLSWMAPNGIPVTPGVGIVPGAATGEVVVGVAGARRLFAELTWATAVPQPNKTTANIVRSKRCIEASCTDTFISEWSALAPPAPCCRRRGLPSA
jgi:hypothetical protein